ncbi:MAG: hypothetical protein PHC70_02815 [Patescibacteria group bacterium]|nr:hypothetical protein [Patescibacteria group bacterium]
MSGTSGQLRIYCEDMVRIVNSGPFGKKLGDHEEVVLSSRTERYRNSLVAFNTAVVMAKNHGVVEYADQLSKAASDLRRDLNECRGGLQSLIRSLSDLSMAKRRREHAQVLVDEFYAVCNEYRHLDRPKPAANCISTPPPASQSMPRLEPALAN